MTDLEAEVLALRDPRRLRALIREGLWDRRTTDLVPGFTQANLAILPRTDALDFFRFCQRNPKPCPVLEVTDPGNPEPYLTAPGADLRTDVPRYCVWREGRQVDEVTNISNLWRDDLVAFLLGCSLTFEEALDKAGVPFRPGTARRYRPIYTTSIECVPAGIFQGPLVVSIRPIPPDLVVRSVQITARFPMTHGAPVHIGDPAAIGIADLSNPDNNDGSGFALPPGHVPVFWACGVTPQRVAVRAGVKFMITHAPGHMFVTDIPSEQLAVL